MTGQHTNSDPRTLNAVAAEYDMLRGLAVVPAGVGMILYGMFFQTNSAFGVVALILAIAAGYPLTEAWYAKRYGRARAGWKRTLIGIAIAVPCLAAVLAALGVDHFEQLPVLLSLVITAVVLWTAIRLAARRLGMTRTDHLVPIGLLIASIAPLVLPGRAEFPAVPYFFVVTGIALIVLGTAWHRRLVATMGPTDE